MKTKNTSSIILLIASACVLFGLSIGIRMNYGILLNAYATQGGIPYDKISLVIAVGELVYGIAQPLLGILAMKKSNAFVLKIGLALLALGFLTSSVVRNGIVLIFTFGILLSGGTGAVCFGMIMGAVSPFIPKEKAAFASGIVNASNGVISSVMSPVMQSFLTSFGIATMAGDLLCGLLCSRVSLKNSLSLLYALRVIFVAFFVFLCPKNAATVLLFATLTGLTGDATVTPTSEIINRKFGAKKLAFLFGIVFVCHQIGAFASTALAGILVELTHSYATAWSADLFLCAFAAAVSFRIAKE